MNTVIRRDIIIGDVHGCSDELNLLIKRVKPTHFDKVYFLGDLIDKGPNVNGVFDLILNLSDKTLVQSVLGNHEEKLIRFLRNTASKRNFYMKDMAQTMKSLVQLEPLHLAFIRDMPVVITLSSDWWSRAVLVHGGIIPNTELRELENKTLDKIKDKNLIKLANKLIRVRHIDKDTKKMVSLERTTDNDIFWAKLYNGEFGHVYYGHSPQYGNLNYRFDYATGLDNGCVFGGYLSAQLRIHEYKNDVYVGTEYREVHVNAKRKYSEPMVL